MEILVSFNFYDVHLAEALRANLFMLEPEQQIVLSPTSYGAVMFKENIAQGISEADAFVFVVGPNGISRWQEIELDLALKRKAHDAHFPLVPILAGEADMPRSLITYDLKWMPAPVVTDRTMLRRLLRRGRKRMGEPLAIVQPCHWLGEALDLRIQRFIGHMRDEMPQRTCCNGRATKLRRLKRQGRR